jgi:hypothetical protein
VAKTRVEHVVGDHAVRAIQAAADEAAYTLTTRAALYLATAGFVAEANTLLARLWSFHWPHSRDVWLDDRGMETIWHAVGQRPADAPFAPQPIDDLERAHRQYMAIDRWTLPMPSRPWPELAGLDLLRRSMALAYPQDAAMPTAHAELEALQGLVKYVASAGGWTLDVSACLAAELAARNGRADQAVELARRWADGYQVYWLNYNFPGMACNRHVAPLLTTGMLAEALGLSSSSCPRYLEGLLDAVDRRIGGGRRLVFGRWPWRRLLARISALAIEADPQGFTEGERRAGWLGRAPARAEAIDATMRRLGVRFPDDYAAFLRTSNGMSAVGVGLPGLVPVEEIEYLRNVEAPELFAIDRAYPGEDTALAMDTCILASEPGAEQMLLLVPPLRSGGSWQTWFFAAWLPGEERYPSFRHYMERELQTLMEAAESAAPNEQPSPPASSIRHPG